MNSLTVNNRLPQLRAIPVQGTPSFRYERMVSGRWVPCNHSRARLIVGAFNRKAKSLVCKSSTDDTATGGELKSTSRVTTQKNDRLSSGALVTRTTACSLLSGSARSSKGWMHER